VGGKPLIKLETPMKLCQSSKRGAFSAALIALGLGLTLIAGCSDSRTSTAGASLERWKSGPGSPTFQNPPVREPVFAVPGTTNKFGNTGPWHVLEKGATYTFFWTGSEGPKATVYLVSKTGPASPWRVFMSVNTKNTGSYRLTLPVNLQDDNFVVYVKTYHYHEGCQAASLTNYYSMTKPKAFAYSFQDVGRPYMGGGRSSAEALSWCKKSGGVNCKVIDVNGNNCKSGAGGVGFTDGFWVARKSSNGTFDAEEIIKQIENSQSNRAAGVNVLTTPNDAKDQKQVKHIASSGVAGGR